jgi:hypothetical protein
VGTPVPSPPAIDPRCGDRTATGRIDCRINQPTVTAHETPYPAVVFAPGDVVEVTADGCVQTGGAGDTWKRYVNPSGSNSASLYHGLIRIPTATKDSALVRINSVVARHLTVTGQGVVPSQLVLSLGYEDDDYSDNGYSSHDNGTEDQCKPDPTHGKDGGPAHVTITIYRGVSPGTPGSRFDFDVVSSATDPNGLPLNPVWSWQQRPENRGRIPSTSLCHNFSVRGSTLGIPDKYMTPSFGDCTDQADTSTVDLPFGEPNSFLCNLATTPFTGDTFAGHVNWFPVTVEGRANWGDHGHDDDYTFGYNAVDAPEQPNPLSVNGRPGLHVEFDSDETIDHFSSDAWNRFHAAVDSGDKARAKLHFDGHTILTGMFGLDGEHSLKAELHPLFALATRRANLENDPADEAWLMFVRNLGDEGYCSSQIWYAGFDDYTFRLPWREGMTSVAVDVAKTRFEGTDGTSPPLVAVLPPPSPSAGVYVTFHLGPPVYSSSILGTGASVPFVDGALHLVWTGPSVAGRRPPKRAAAGGPSRTAGLPRGPGASSDADGAEDAIRAAIEHLPARQRQRVRNARILPGTPAAAVHRLPPTGAARIITDSTAVARTTTPRAVKVGPAARKMARDAAQMKALCAVSRNAPAGLPAEACTGGVTDRR